MYVCPHICVHTYMLVHIHVYACGWNPELMFGLFLNPFPGHTVLQAVKVLMAGDSRLFLKFLRFQKTLAKLLYFVQSWNLVLRVEVIKSVLGRQNLYRSLLR